MSAFATSGRCWTAFRIGAIAASSPTARTERELKIFVRDPL